MAFPLVHVARSGGSAMGETWQLIEKNKCAWHDWHCPHIVHSRLHFCVLSICHHLSMFSSGGMELFEAMDWIVGGGGTDVLWTFWWWFEGDYSGWWSKIQRSLMHVVAVCESKHQVLFLNGSGGFQWFPVRHFVEISHSWEDLSRVHTIGIFGAFFFSGEGKGLASLGWTFSYT